MADLDFSDIVAKFAKEYADELLARSSAAVKRHLALLGPNLSSHIKDYASKATDGVRRVRTILSDQPSDLVKMYEPIFFDSDKSDYSEDFISELVGRGTQIVVKGQGAAGKSMFMRRHFLRVIEKGGCLPFLIELRGYSYSNSGFFAYVLDQVRGLAPWIDVNIFHHLLNTRRIELLLDALDEVSHEKRINLADQLHNFIRDHPRARVIITTRYGDRYGLLSNLAEYHVKAFGRDQTIALINGLDFDADSKDRFVSALSDGLYERSPDLLSNPLLASIML